MAKDTECLGCGQKFKQKDTSVKCTVCGLWAHKSCSGLSNEFFKCLAEQFKASGRAYWACRSCNAYAEGMNHRVREVEETAKQAVRIGKENEEEIVKLMEELAKEKERVSKVVEKAEQNQLAEMTEREEKRKNVVIHGLQEPTGSDGRKRMEEDRKKLDKIFEILEVNVSAENDVEFCRRVGEQGERSRPLIVGFYTDWSRSILLKNARYLNGTEMEELSIAPDLTQRQRAAEREMIQEAERKNEEELTEEDLSKNLVWRVVGKKGQKRLIKCYNQSGAGAEMRGNWRGMSRGRVASRSGATAGSRGSARGHLQPELLSNRGTGRGFLPRTRGGRAGRGRADVDGRRKRNRNSSNEEQEQPQPNKTRYGERRGTENVLLTGANTEDIQVVAQELTEAVMEGDSDGNMNMVEDEATEEDQEETDTMEGIRLGALSQQQP